MNNNNNNKNPRLLEPQQIAKKVDFGLIKKDKQQLDIRTNILANFCRPFKNNVNLKDSYALFVNTYFFDYDILDIDPESLIERASKILGYNTYFLIIVYPQYEEIKTEKIKSDFYPHCEINVIHTSFEELFSSGLMHKIYLENENSTLSFRTVINFRGWPYGALQAAFRAQNIILSGGSSQKRHILNPWTHRFSQFVSAFESYNLNGVINSFHNVKPLEVETNQLLKAALGPKVLKDKNSIGNISTKSFDNRWRALFKKFFNQDLPIRENKNSVSAKKIDANVSTNTQNNDSLSSNNQISQITVNLNQTNKEKEESINLKQDGLDFANDPWIDNELYHKLYHVDPVYKKLYGETMKKVSVNTDKKLADQLKQMKNESEALKSHRQKEHDQKIQEELIAKQRAIKQSKLEEIELNKQRVEIEKENKLEKYFNSIIQYLINSRRSVNKIKKGKTLSKLELEPTKNRILKAKSSEVYTSLNQAFPSIFKSYLNKSFGPYNRITKDNILSFKKLLLKQHPILIQKAKQDLANIRLIKENILLKKAQEKEEEARRIAQFKFAFPEMKEEDIPAHVEVSLLGLELGKRRVAQEKEDAKFAEAERIRLASILSKEEIQEKRVKEIQEILNNSSISLHKFDRLDLERELKRLLRRSKDNNASSSDNNESSSDKNNSESTSDSKEKNNSTSNKNNKRNYSTFAQKRNYHTTSKNSLNNFSSDNKGKDVLKLLTTDNNNELKGSIENTFEDNEKNIKLFSFLDYVRDVLNDETLNTYEKQIKIETEWMENIKFKLLDPEFSKTRLSIHITRAFKILEIQLGGKKNLKSISILSDDFKTFLIKIESLILAFGYIITYCSRMNYTYIASLIGNAIFWEYFRFYNKNIAKKNVEEYPKIKNYDLFYSENNFSEEQAVRLGDLLIECFIRIEIIDRRFDIEDKGKAYIEIRQDCINEIVENTFIVPTSLPMCHKPNEWSDDKRGGFLTNMLGKGKGEDLIQGSALKEKHLIENKKELFDSINYLDSIKFKINNDFLDFILNDGYYLLSLEEEKNWTQNLISIKIAQTFINTPFYINTFADWRGRIYTNSFFISYQGSNLAKNLVYFNEGEILNEKGLDYLYVYGANAYNENGLAKKSFNETPRINWVKLNYLKILKMDKDFLINAKEKFTFAAFCLVIKKLHQNDNAIIHLPIFLDATCSGIQHLAALMKDLDSASRVNLIEQNNDEIVADIYSDVVGPVNEALNKFGLENMQTHSHFTRIQLTRKEIKSLVMTKPYNASIFGMTQQLARIFELTEKAKEFLKQKINFNTKTKFNADFNDNNDQTKALVKTEEDSYNPYIYIAPALNNEKVLLSKNDLFLIAKIVDNQVFMMFPALKEIYDYLLNISKVLRDLNIPITWFTPAGIKITQHYLKEESHNYYMRSGNTRKTIILRNKMKDTNSNEYIVDRRKQVEAIIPNVIHSLDASHLMFVIRDCIGTNILPIITVHDCFGTLPNKMFHLEQVVKKQFVVLYTKENFLNKFHKKLLESIEDNNYIIFKKGERKGRKEKILELLRTFDNANIKKKSSNTTGKITTKSKLTKEEQILNLSNKITKKFKNNNALVVFIDDLNFQKFPNSTTTKIESAYSFLEVPSLPKLGKLDLTKIINSKYMIT